jgi:hypothetical protein
MDVTQRMNNVATELLEHVNKTKALSLLVNVIIVVGVVCAIAMKLAVQPFNLAVWAA